MTVAVRPSRPALLTPCRSPCWPWSPWFSSSPTAPPPASETRAVAESAAAVLLWRGTLIAATRGGPRLRRSGRQEKHQQGSARKSRRRNFRNENKFSLGRGEVVEMGGGFLLGRNHRRRLILSIWPQGLVAGGLGVGGQEPPHLLHLRVSVQLSVAWAGGVGVNLGKLHHAASHYALVWDDQTEGGG